MDLKDIDVIVGNVGILAQNVSVNTIANLKPEYYLGFNQASLKPQGNKNISINMSYFMNVRNEPHINIIESLKTNSSGISPIRLEVAGLKYSGYMQAFNFSIEPNGLIRNNVSYVAYATPSGTFSSKRGVINYDENVHKVGHASTSFVTSSGTFLSVPTFGLEYSFTATYQPIYTMGNLEVSQVVLNKATEDISITRNEYVEVLFSGQNITNETLSNNTEKNIELKSIRFNWSDIDIVPITFNTKNAQIISTILTASENTPIRTKIDFQQNF